MYEDAGHNHVDSYNRLYDRYTKLKTETEAQRSTPQGNRAQLATENSQLTTTNQEQKRALDQYVSLVDEVREKYRLAEQVRKSLAVALKWNDGLCAILDQHNLDYHSVYREHGVEDDE
jgi:DNA mismatch repair ATPase MutL